MDVTGVVVKTVVKPETVVNPLVGRHGPIAGVSGPHRWRQITRARLDRDLHLDLPVDGSGPADATS